ncbi:hypothetical protein ACQP3J_30880, partial [Escherichia coli]
FQQLANTYQHQCKRLNQVEYKHKQANDNIHSSSQQCAVGSVTQIHTEGVSGVTFAYTHWSRRTDFKGLQRQNMTNSYSLWGL